MKLQWGYAFQSIKLLELLVVQIVQRDDGEPRILAKAMTTQKRNEEFEQKVVKYKANHESNNEMPANANVE